MKYDFFYHSVYFNYPYNNTNLDFEKKEALRKREERFITSCY